VQQVDSPADEEGPRPRYGPGQEFEEFIIKEHTRRYPTHIVKYPYQWGLEVPKAIGLIDDSDEERMRNVDKGQNKTVVDRGVDLIAYDTDTGHYHLIQCKHYAYDNNVTQGCLAGFPHQILVYRDLLGLPKSPDAYPDSYLYTTAPLTPRLRRFEAPGGRYFIHHLITTFQPTQDCRRPCAEVTLAAGSAAAELTTTDTATAAVAVAQPRNEKDLTLHYFQRDAIKAICAPSDNGRKVLASPAGVARRSSQAMCCAISPQGLPRRRSSSAW
jgi:hypothetical protein